MKIQVKVVAALLLLCLSFGESAAADRPNIVFCFADDWGPITMRREGPAYVLIRIFIRAIVCRHIMIP